MGARWRWSRRSSPAGEDESWAVEGDIHVIQRCGIGHHELEQLWFLSSTIHE